MKKQMFLSIGIVKNNSDPMEHGRLQLFIPSIDNEDYEVKDLPWANYVSPFGGTTANFKVGRDDSLVPGASSYGMWAIPKNSAQVLCGFQDGNPMMRFWLGCFYLPEYNRTLPQAVNGVYNELDDSGQYPHTEISHYVKNLTEAGLQPGSKHYKSRGGHQRSVSHPSNSNTNKSNDNGYYTKPLEPEKSDSQIVSITTPGRHYIAMSDVNEECRIRIKSTEGSQILIDDTNERIYISTAKGRNYVELDETSGKIYVYSDSKINIHSENDLNLSSNENINIVAKKRINLHSEERGISIQAKMGIGLLSETSNIKISASRDIHIKTTNGEKASAVPAKAISSPPPFNGKPLGVIRDFAEEAGSGSSNIFINANQNINIRSEDRSVFITGSLTVDIRAVKSNINFAANHIDSSSSSGSNKNLAKTASSSTASLSKIEIRSNMIIPKHESWTRDEDEAISPTPRNKRWNP